MSGDDRDMDHNRVDVTAQNRTYAVHVVERNRKDAQRMAEALSSLARSQILRALKAVKTRRAEWQGAPRIVSARKCSSRPRAMRRT